MNITHKEDNILKSIKAIYEEGVLVRILANYSVRTGVGKATFLNLERVNGIQKKTIVNKFLMDHLTDVKHPIKFEFKKVTGCWVSYDESVFERIRELGYEIGSDHLIMPKEVEIVPIDSPLNTELIQELLQRGYLIKTEGKNIIIVGE